MYPIQEDYPFHTTLLTFDLLRMYSVNNKSSLLFTMQSLLAKIMIFVFNFISPVLHLIIMVKANYSDFNISEDLANVIGGLGMSGVYCLMSWFHEKWEPFFYSLIDFHLLGRPETFPRVIEHCRTLSRICSLYCILAGAVYAITSIMLPSNCEILQMKIEENLFCSMGPAWFPFDLDRRIIFFCQFTTVIILYIPGTQSYFMYYEAVELIVSHMYLLQSHLDTVFQNQLGYSRFHYLKRCVGYHKQIISLAKQLNSLLVLFSGHMSLVWAVCFGCIGNQMLESKPLGALFYLGGYVMLLSLLVIPGQTLISESENLAKSIYSAKWYLGTVEEQKTIRLMLQMGQVPLRLSVKPFGNYQYSLFIMIIKTSYSYMMLLQQSTGHRSGKNC